MSLQENLEKIRNDFSNLDPENMGGWPLPVKIVCWVLVAVLVLILAYQFVLKEQQGELDQARQKELALRSEFAQKVKDAANLDAYRAQMKEMNESFEALKKQLPKDTEVPGLRDDISNSGQTSGLNIDVIDLLAEKKADFYVELPIKIRVSGGYHDFGTFISAIAGLPRIVTLHDFSIAAAAADGANKKDAAAKDSGDGRGAENLSMEIMAKTYRYKAEDEGDSAGNNAKSKEGGK
ncbi:MAG: type 4a pilus biogenesis protein PilO [Pseudomonadales bacterium]|nr:type 4a pilus biogenesis protein PilO [Pseudomonadales bacterium]